MASCTAGGGLATAPSAAPAPEPPPAPSAKPDVAAAPPAIPDTPAGNVLRDWLDAFNSGDPVRMEAYIGRHKHPEPARGMLDFRNQTGGFDLLAIDKSDRLHLAFRVKERASPTLAVGRLEVKDGDPAEIVSLRLRAVPPGLTAADLEIVVDSAVRARVVDGIAAKLGEYYVFPDVARKMVEALRAHQQNGEYDAVQDGEAFATLLTEHLRAVSHDRHLSVEYAPVPLPKDEPKGDPPISPERRARLERNNCGFVKTERLDGNIGYVRFNMFAPVEVCAPKATAAFQALGAVGALIFDLRDNGGGQPEMVAFVSSYLFDKRTHLNDIYERKADKTTEFWTKPDAPGPKFPHQPVFVLTSSRTFSGAEEFSYNLKILKRAVIVGETTGGGAHPTGDHRVDDHFLVFVPYARAINPITKTNWEGKGVEPDVRVGADQALDEARKLAADRLRKHPKK
jgi:hypothetical protein